LRDAGRRPGTRDLAGQLPHHLRMGARDLRRRLRGVVGQVPAEQGEDRRDRHLAVHGLHLELPLEGGIDAVEGQALLRRLPDLARGPVEHVERLLVVIPLEVARPQEAAGVLAHEQREIRLLGDVARVVDPLLDHHVGQGEAEGGVAADFDGDPPVGVDRRGVVVGRDGHHAGPVVAGLVDEVRLGDLRVGRVAAPDQDQVGVEDVVGGARGDDLSPGDVRPRVVIADVRVHVQHQRVQHVGDPHGAQAGTAAGLGRSLIPDDGLGPVGGEGVDRDVGDLAQRLLPRDALPSALAPLAHPLERVLETGGVVHPLAVAGPLLTAAGVEVRDFGIRLGVGSHLLLAERDPLLDVDVPGAAPLIPAVHEVGSLGDAVPAPLPPVDVLEAPVRDRAGDTRDGLRARRRPAGRSSRPAELEQRQGEHPARSLQEASPRNPGGHRVSPLKDPSGLGRDPQRRRSPPGVRPRSPTAPDLRELARLLCGGSRHTLGPYSSPVVRRPSGLPPRRELGFSTPRTGFPPGRGIQETYQAFYIDLLRLLAQALSARSRKRGGGGLVGNLM
jgi:hypothetical protein